MTLQVKKGGAYALTVAVSVKKNGVYTAVVGVFAKVSGAYQSVLVGGAEPAPAALAITDTSQPASAIYSLRKVVAGYAGNCLSIRNSVPTTVLCGFDAEGDVDTSALAALAAAGNGTLEVTAWYDQSGNARNLSSTARPVLILNAMQNAAGKWLPAIDFPSKSLNMGTSLTWLDVGGTSNLGIHAVVQTQGWSSAGTHARNPAVYSAGVHGVMLGYGTSSSAPLMSGAYTATGETVMYAKPGELMVDSGVPDISRVRNIWFNQSGANVAGGADVRKMFSGRPHGKTSITGQRLVLGNNGLVNQSHNGAFFEVVVYQNATALPDNEAWAVAIGQREYWGALGAARYPDRYYPIGAGQSLIQYLATVASSSDGTAGNASGPRIFTPAVKAALQFSSHPDREIQTSFGSTAIGGTSILKTNGATTPDGPGGTSWLAWNGVSSVTKFWWDQFLDIPGPALVSCLSQLPAYLGAAYAKTVILWDQGQAEADKLTSLGGESETLTVANWVIYTKKVWAAIRTALGNPAIPIYIEPLGRQSGDETWMRVFRMAQEQFAIDDPTVHIGTEVHDVVRQDGVHPAPGPYNVSVGISSDFGFDLTAARLANGYHAMLDATVKYSGPKVLSAAKFGANAVDVTIGWDSRGSGTDFTPTSGIVGFEIADGSGARTISAAVRQSSSTIRLTVSGAALSGTVNVIHNPCAAVDRLFYVIDNAGRPLSHSAAITAS